MTSIPDAIWTQHVAILAKTGRGKTIVAKGGAARLMKQHVRVGVVDPTAAWWGMRLNADGKSKAFDMVIFGGDHADIEIKVGNDFAVIKAARDVGEKIGTLVGEADWPWILDISTMGAEQRAPFMTGFAEALFAANRRRLNLFMDECHLYMPQQKLPTRASAHMTASCNNLVSGGRSRGLNVTMISQRSAKVAKDSLTQAETLITLGMIAPHDIAAAEAWVKVQGDMKAASTMLKSLPALPVGTGWIYAPELAMLEKVKFPMIDTFDSSRAPGAGEDLRAPTELGQIDIAEIRAKLAPVGRKAPAPALAMPASKPVAKTIIRDEASALRDREAAFAAGRRQGNDEGWAAGFLAGHKEGFESGFHACRFKAKEWVAGIAAAYVAPVKAPKAPRAALISPSNGASSLSSVSFAPSGPRATSAAPPQIDGLGKAERAILGVLAHFPQTGADRTKVAIMAGYSARSGSFANNLSTLRTAGLLAAGDPLRATEAGLAAAGDPGPLPTGDALVGYWLGHRALGKAEKAILTVLVDARGSMSRSELAAAAGYSAESGSFANNLSRLRTLNLISGSQELTAAAEFSQ